MKRLLKLAITLLLFLSSHTTYAQWYKSIDLEVGVNRSRVQNTRQIFEPLELRSGFDDRVEQASYTNNVSVSSGIQITKRHNLRIRYAKNNFGSSLTGLFHNGIAICGVGINVNDYMFDLNRDINPIQSKSLGITHELQLPLSYGQLTITTGLEKHWNNYENTFIFFNNMDQINYALHLSTGYLIPIADHLQLHAKVFATRLFANSPEAILSWRQDPNRRHIGYIPLQMGLELGLRLSLQSE